MRHRNDGFAMKGVARLLLAFLCASATGEAFAVDLISNLIRCAPGMTPYVVLDGEERSSGKFYGYVNGGTGPGESAFKDAKAWADEHHVPLVVVFDNGSGNTFTADLNDDEDYQGGRYLLQWMNGKAGPDNYNCMFTYFKGGTTAPAACKDAYDFCKQYGAGSLFPLVVCYWKWHDGTIRTSVTSGLSSVGSFKGPVDSFISKNKPPPYTPPKCSIGFAVKDGELKMKPETAEVYVPFMRTNSTDAVGSVYGLEVTYPDNAVSSIAFTADAVGEIKLEAVATAGKWAEGKSIQLVLFNTNKVVVATNHIACVATPANGPGCPYLPDATNALNFGVWSMDLGRLTNSIACVEDLYADLAAATEAHDAATNALAAAVAAYDSATNALAAALATSNTTYAAYAEKQVALDLAVGEYDAATNALAAALATSNTTYAAYVEKQVAFVLAVGEYGAATNALAVALATSNTTYTAYAEKQAALDLAVGEYDVATNALAAALAASNTTYTAYVEKQSALDVAVGEYDAATNDLAAAWATSNTTYAAYVEKQSALDAAVAEYDAATNALAIAIAEHGLNSPEYDDAQSDVIAASVKKTTAQGELDAAREAYDAAVADVEAKQGVPAEKENAMNVAKDERDTAKGEYDAAVADVDVKQGVATEKATALGTAQTERDTAKGEYDAAVLDAAAKQGVATEMEIVLGTAQTECDTAKGEYDAAAADAVAKQGDVAEKETALGTAQTERDTAKGEYDAAAADAVAKQGDVAEREPAMNDAQGEADAKTEAFMAAMAALQKASGKYFLVIHGGIVWDDALVALDAGVFATAEFTKWCESNQVSLVYLDKAEPETGAALFSYNVALNGNSGASFMSMNGLSQAVGETLADQAAEAAMALGLTDVRGAHLYHVALVRADGSVCGLLNPQYNENGTCDRAENMARLDELLAQAADPQEALNDTPVGAADARTPTLEFGETSSTNTLSVNDTCDVFVVANIPANAAVTFEVTRAGGAPAGASPSTRVLQFTDAERTTVEAVEPLVDGVWVFTAEQVAAGLAVEVSAYTDAGTISAKYGGKSTFAYTVKSMEAAENPGKVGFDPVADVVKEGEWESVRPGDAGTSADYPVRVVRTGGATGAVKVKVSLDMSDDELAAIHGRFEWPMEGVELEWADLEAGEKTAVIRLFNDGACYDASNIVFKVEVVSGDATVADGKDGFVLTYVEEDPETRGSLEIFDVALEKAGDGKMYVRSGETVAVLVNRAGGSNGNAIGTVVGKVGGKAFETNVYTWAAMQSGVKTNAFTMPPVTAAKTEVAFALSSTIGKGADAAKVYVLAADAPEFESSRVAWSGIQYTVTETNLVALSALSGMTVKSLNRISGTVPAGVKVSLVDGKFLVTGTPTAGMSTSATFFVVLTRDGGGSVYSMPVTVTFESKSLSDVNGGFEKARAWTGLPVTRDGRLKGLFDLTVAKNGKTSARYRKVGGKTVAFASPGLAGVDPDGTATFGAEKSVKGVGDYSFAATLGADGGLTVTIVDPEEASALSASVEVGAEAWSAANTAARFGGDYVAAFVLGAATNENTLCFGSPTMRFRFNTASAWKRGAVTFAGTLPNGKAVSGTAYLVPTVANASVASLPVFSSSSSDTLSAMIDIGGAGLAATQGVVPFWSHGESGIESLSYENDYDVVGALWSWDAWRSAVASGAKISSDGISGTINKTSGIAAGTMRRDVSGTGRLSTLSWKGVALPGETPRVLGACWYNVSMPYVDSNNNNRTRTVKAGDTVGLPATE